MNYLGIDYSVKNMPAFDPGLSLIHIFRLLNKWEEEK